MAKNNIDKVDMDKEKGAIICELWEMANELKSEGFKQWTKKKRTEHVVEELVDVLHFYLETGNILEVVEVHFWIEKHSNIMKQLLAINTTLLAMDGALMWTMSFAQFRGLIDILGYDWDRDIVPAYHLKHAKNIERQKAGY
jgi:dimeric dUTPase (all-alpha-NTP-PPase superfamily)